MRSPGSLAKRLRPLDLSVQENAMLLSLTDTLTAHNIAQSNSLVLTKEGHADPRAWRELRRKDGLRVYKERVPATPVGAGRGSGGGVGGVTAGAVTLPSTPSLLMLGTTPGNVDDIMYSLVAPTAQEMRLKTNCVHDGVVDSKVLVELERPTVDAPFRHVSVRWSLYALSEPRDFVCVEATGVTRTRQGERVGYHLAHSVAFPSVPSFAASHNVARGNRSVCWLFRQKSVGEVECYVRGFFEFEGGPNNELLTNIGLQAIATQWLSFSRQVEYAHMKKLVWRLRRNSGDFEDFGFTELQPAVLGAARADKKVLEAAMGGVGVSGKSEWCCSVCSKSFRLLDRKTTCKSCAQPVCPRCRVKKRVCVMAPDQRTLLEKRRTFCSPCISEIAMMNARTIAQEELMLLAGDDDLSDVSLERGWYSA